MFPLDIFVTYTIACLLLVISPGPDNLLVVGRGLSQGYLAAIVSGLSSGAGILFHVLAATFGLTLGKKTLENIEVVGNFVVIVVYNTMSTANQVLDVLHMFTNRNHLFS